MTFRSKLFWVFTLALLLSVALIAAGVMVVTQRAFEGLNQQHSDALRQRLTEACGISAVEPPLP